MLITKHFQSTRDGSVCYVKTKLPFSKVDGSYTESSSFRSYYICYSCWTSHYISKLPGNKPIVELTRRLNKLKIYKGFGLCKDCLNFRETPCYT